MFNKLLEKPYIKRYFGELQVFEWVTFLFNAYFTYAIINAILLPIESLFLKLPENNHILLILLLIFFLFNVQLIARKHFNAGYFTKILIVLTALFMLVTLWKSPSLMISFGLYFLGFALFATFSLSRERFRFLIPLSILISLPRTVYALYRGYPGDLGRFVISYENWNFRHLWLFLLAGIGALAIICLLTPVLEKVEIWKLKPKLLKLSYLLVIFIGLSYVIYLAVISAYKVKTLSVSTFDIGIFTQMFESMLRDFTPMTTLERDRLLSHFAVHISPIFYLMLPFYAIWPYLETLEVLQVLIVFSGVIPLYFILKKLSLPEWLRPLILLWFFAIPAFTTAGSYRMHENCFLVPLILWLVYANMAQWTKRLFIITLLTLMVKEDAFIYVFSVGLYFLLQRRLHFTKKRRLKVFLSQMVFPFLYFVTCIYLLTRFGDGAMVTRFDNFLLAEESGLIAVIRNIILNPTYTFASLFTQRKLKYVFMVFATQAFLPLVQKRWENFVLLVPFVVINLLSDYHYQADLGFQYSYGTNTLIFFMSLLALESCYEYWTEDKLSFSIINRRLASIVAIGFIMSTSVLYSFIHTWHYDMMLYFDKREMYDSIHETLAKVDKNQRILAFSAYTVDLRQTEELYDIFYHNEREVDLEVDLVVLPRSVFEGTSTEKEVVANYLKNGYQVSDASTEYVVIITK
ncbi:DUF2079 domain-containing protein [Streptococcus rifensis]